MNRSHLIPREHHLSKLRNARDSPFIKVITGIRRCGKSTLMEMFIDELKGSGVQEDRIFHINLDDEGCGVTSYMDLITLVEGHIGNFEGSYLFFDEIQNVQEWERAISTFYVRDADVYITGSNSNMLSSELSTKLSGRTLDIRIMPLTFSEYIDFRGGDVREELLEDYIRYGGFPAVALSMDLMPNQTRDLLDGIYHTVFNKDVTGRHPIRSNTVISKLATYLMKNIGDRTSVRNTVNYIVSSGIKTQPITVDEYIGYLEEALLFTRAKRLDSKAKEYLRTSDKFYVTDLGIRNTRVPFHMNDLDGMLENIVFNELLYRYGDVAICNVNQYEVDFVADPMGTPSYYQVSLNISDPKTLEREIRPLRAIDDNYPKTVITYDRFLMDDIDGIRIVRLYDWLLGSKN